MTCRAYQSGAAGRNPLLTRLFVVGVVFLSLFFVHTVPAQAQDTGILPSCAASDQGCESLDDVAALFRRIGNVILGLTGSLLVLLICYAGIIYLTAAGRQDQIQKANKMLNGTLVGLIIILTSATVLYYFEGALKGQSPAIPAPAIVGEEGVEVLTEDSTPTAPPSVNAACQGAEDYTPCTRSEGPGLCIQEICVGTSGLTVDCTERADDGIRFVNQGRTCSSEGRICNNGRCEAVTYTEDF